MVQVLKQCGDDLSRENIMRQAAAHQGSRTADAAAGHADQHLAEQFQPDPADAACRRSTATSWQLFGDLLQG